MVAKMIFAPLLVFSTAACANILPRQDSYSTPSGQSVQSPNFIIHSRLAGASTFDGSLGYLHAEYAYPPGYYATLHASQADAITGYISDTKDVSNATLTFPESDGYYQGFVVNALSQRYPNSLAQMFSGQYGTKGMYIDGKGLLDWQSPDKVPVSWFACENWTLEWGPATALFYKWSNTTTSDGCKNVDLVVEYS